MGQICKDKSGASQYRLEIKRRLGHSQRWAAYSYETLQDGRSSKAPRRRMAKTLPDGRVLNGFALTDVPGTWQTYKKAVELALQFRAAGNPDAGVGIMLEGLSGLLVLDLDKVKDSDGRDLPWVLDLLAEVHDCAHVYETPSGNGYRIVMSVPLDTPSLHHTLRREGSDGEVGSQLEVYHRTARFITVLPGAGRIGRCLPELLASLIDEIKPGVGKDAADWQGGVIDLEQSAIWGTRDAVADALVKPCALSSDLRKRIVKSKAALDRSGSWQSVVGRLWEEGYSKESTLALLQDIKHPGLEKYSTGRDRIDRELERAATKAQNNRARRTMEGFTDE